MSEREAFLRAYEREHAITRKVLHAFPAEQMSLKPSERSNSAMQLAATFVAEQMLSLRALKGEPVLGGVRDSAPTTWDAALRTFDAQHEEIVRLLRDGGGASFEGTVQFPVAPRQMGDWRPSDFLWFLLHDQIHHRGQLTVYLRMAGGKVPSIYGPSGDEPWT
jgi:uncharacterized damage-inducible protein DinB